VSRRVLLKLSGDALGSSEGGGLDPEAFSSVASTLAPVVADGVEIAVVVGGGNLARGRALVAPWLPRTTADTAGMLATVMNGVVLAAALRDAGADAEVFTPWPTGGETHLFSARRGRDHLSGGGIAVLAGGTGNPFFTTDTGAALRALELDCDELLKGTRVDGIYTADPETDPNAERLPTIGFTEVLLRGLQVMDATAVALCREHGLPIRVFCCTDDEVLGAALRGEDVGTVVRPESAPEGEV
jgi:uridylate kinase